VRLSLAATHAACVHGNYQIVEAIEATLTLFHKLRLEVRPAVASDFNLDRATLAGDGLLGFTVA